MRKFAALTTLALSMGAWCIHPLPLASSAASSNPVSLGWPVYGGQLAGDHYSSLSQINRKNVQRLRVAWQFDTGEKGGLQTSPIIVGQVLYAFTPTQKVIALDASSGKLLWKFDSGIEGTQPARSVTYWTDGKESRLFAGVMNYLYALDPATGKPIAGFGEDGRIDLRKDLRGDYQSQSIALTSPGIVYQDLIIVGGRNPETHPAPPGDIRAFDVHTGALRWRFHTIPHPGEAGYSTWPKEAWKQAGAANNWAGMALDAKRGIVYVPTGSAVSDFYGGDRTGDDLFADTLLALDAGTGKRIWHFQGVRHDLWDRDFPSPPALVTVRHDGKQVDAIAQTTKQGFLYLFDRATGKPLFPVEYLHYPASNVPGETTSPTQPRPVRPEPFARQLLTEDMLTTRTPEAHQWALQQFKTFRSEGQFVPLSLDRQTVVFPGFDGGAEWGGPAVDPTSAVIYVNANDIAWTGGLTENKPGGGAGESIYRSQCGVCHGLDKAGSPPAFPSLVAIERRQSEPQIMKTIRQGKGRMPSFPNLDDAELAALMQYLATGATGSATAEDQAKRTAVPPPAPAASGGEADNPMGANLYRDSCAVCHGDHREGIPPAFPVLLGIGQRLTAQQIRDTILNGKGSMPPFPMLRNQELDALLRYLGNSGNTIGSGQDKTEMTPESDLADGDSKYTFTGYRRFLDPDGYPAIAPPWGTLNAIDLNTGNTLWKVPLGEYPALAAKGMTSTGSENYGGPVVTAGGLVFIGATIFDRKFRAFDSSTGQLLWETVLPFPGTATPATYMIQGKQYVVIAAGGGKDPKAPSGGVYVAFALP